MIALPSLRVQCVRDGGHPTLKQAAGCGNEETKGRSRERGPSGNFSKLAAQNML
jgi:hypothetical protein